MNTRTLRRTAAATLATATLFALTACQSTATDTAAEDDGQLETVSILYAGIAYEPLFIAEQQGYFDEAGLEVDIRPGGPPQDNLAQAVGGSADLIVAAWDTMVKSTAEDMPVAVVAGNSIVSDTVDTSGVIVRADSDIETVADLEGATVAFDSVGAGGTAEFNAALIEAGVSPDSVEIVAIPYATMQVSLENEQVDAVFPSDPFYAPMAEDESNRVIANPVRETRSGVPITLWAATNDWLAEHPEEAEAFLAALDKAMEFYEDPANLDVVLAVRAEVSQQPLEDVSTSLPPMRLAIDKDATAAAIQQLVDSDMVEDPLTVDEILWSEAPTL